VLLFFAVPLLAVLLFPLAQEPEIGIPEEGAISDVEIIAPVGFRVKKTERELAAERLAAEQNEPPVLDVDPTVPEEIERRLERIGRELMRPVAEQLPTEEFRASVARQLGIELSAATVELLRSAQGATVIEQARQHLAQVMGNAVVPAEVVAALAGRDVVTLRRGGSSFYKSLTSVTTVEEARQAMLGAARRLYPRDVVARDAFIELCRSLITPNAVYNIEETERRIQEAVAAINVYTGEVVNKNERILDSHERVTAHHVNVLRSLKQYQEEHLLTGPVGGTLLGNLGRFAALCLLLGTLVVYLRVQQPQLYVDSRSLGLLATLGAIVLVLAFIIIRALDLSPLVVPMVMLPLLATVLLRRGAALFVALTMPFMFLILLVSDTARLDPGLLVFLVGSSVAGITAVLAVENLQKRHELYWPVLLVGAAYVLVAAAVGTALRMPPHDIAASALLGALSAFLAGAVAMVLLPVLERLFRITTNFTLLELLDRNHVLLKRMSMEAPGTFHHSMLVAELAREGVERVGGNALLAQVGAYYHDIGKIEKPQYFIENQTGRNVHDKLTPTMSCLVVGSHVREGIMMAQEAGLPPEIIDFIPEHHGTTLMSYFFHKAKESDENIDETDFRYPGPRPQSKETAVVMLADSVEAAARSLDDPTPGSLRIVVKRIIDTRINDGQLDNSALTLADMARVRDAFVTVLMRFFHHRIQYPGQANLAARSDNGRTASRTGGRAAPASDPAAGSGQPGAVRGGPATERGAKDGAARSAAPAAPVGRPAPPAAPGPRSTGEATRTPRGAAADDAHPSRGSAGAP
jgi:putative nucleotidyltransferase with HDIG domain